MNPESIPASATPIWNSSEHQHSSGKIITSSQMQAMYAVQRYSNLTRTMSKAVTDRKISQLPNLFHTNNNPIVPFPELYKDLR